jgi:hypothetical protein
MQGVEFTVRQEVSSMKAAILIVDTEVDRPGNIQAEIVYELSLILTAANIPHEYSELSHAENIRLIAIFDSDDGEPALEVAQNYLSRSNIHYRLSQLDAPLSWENF